MSPPRASGQLQWRGCGLVKAKFRNERRFPRRACRALTARGTGHPGRHSYILSLYMGHCWDLPTIGSITVCRCQLTHKTGSRTRWSSTSFARSDRPNPLPFIDPIYSLALVQLVKLGPLALRMVVQTLPSSAGGGESDHSLNAIGAERIAAGFGAAAPKNVALFPPASPQSAPGSPVSSSSTSSKPISPMHLLTQSLEGRLLFAIPKKGV